MLPPWKRGTTTVERNCRGRCLDEYPHFLIVEEFFWAMPRRMNLFNINCNKVYVTSMKAWYDGCGAKIWGSCQIIILDEYFTEQILVKQQMPSKSVHVRWPFILLIPNKPQIYVAWWPICVWPIECVLNRVSAWTIISGLGNSCRMGACPLISHPRRWLCCFAKNLPPTMWLFFLRLLSWQTICFLELVTYKTPIIMEERTKTIQHVNHIKH